MHIRPYQPGDEDAQARIYNAATGTLPGFKPANPDEVARRYRTIDPDPSSKRFAVEGDEVVGYAALNPNGRISAPWCLPEAQAARALLLDALLDEARRRGLAEVWAAYRADWEPALAFLRAHGFVPSREMINYVATTDRLPRRPIPEGRVIEPLRREDLPRLVTLGRGLFGGVAPSNPYLDAEGLFALRTIGDGEIRGAALLVARPGYAEPTRIDASMPCFRLGAFGTERERHKRVNGLFSCVFDDPETAETLLSEAVRRLTLAGASHVAAQAPSDRPDLVAFHDAFFDRQGSFPILSRRLEG
jgi:GNAT superfamily N-acetyltransferase